MKKLLLLISVYILFLSCSTTKNISKNPITIIETEKIDSSFSSKEIQNKTISEKEILIADYQGSKTIINNLIHTKLSLSFNYQKKHVLGDALLTLKPHYYKTDSLTLDAQQFIIHKVLLQKENKTKPLKYSYNNSVLKIKLDKEYSKNEQYTINIKYTARPEKVTKTGSGAIKDNKGLYFIDANTDNPQIWTQGETQSNSAWFPTIDSPNQKMTQEILLTVNKEFKTLSNGKLIASLLNNNGTRTDHWKQDKPHAPYLAMITVGKFNILKDYWRDLSVDVYTEAGDETKAKDLFKKTYKMIEFYSRKLDYDFPWDKYAQIVVRDFVSGAMENTGAVVFGDYVLGYRNEEQRISYECVVAHELSHHWFGDLVTCESWANLPLNESFATYFEYLWLEYEYGRYSADIHLREDYSNYTFEHFFKNEDLIRFYNKHRDNMFDAHSYQKGGLILHMLRYTVGDEAFWDALELYLKKNEFKAVEIHHLRLAFEEVTGQDLNWFFNQWFLNKGIPELKVSYNYNTENKKTKITIEQIQDFESNPLYKIPTFVDIYYNDTTIRKPITINKHKNVFEFNSEKKPLFLNFDPDNSILCKKTENYSQKEYIEILDKAPLFEDKNEALDNLVSYSGKRISEVYFKLTKHHFWKFRYKALYALNQSDKTDWTEEMKKQYHYILTDIAKNDINLRVKKLALSKLR